MVFAAARSTFIPEVSSTAGPGLFLNVRDSTQFAVRLSTQCRSSLASAHLLRVISSVGLIFVMFESDAGTKMKKKQMLLVVI